MNNVLVSKVLASEEVAKLVDEFDADDFAMRDDAEIKAFVSLLLKESKILEEKKDEAIRASGSAEISEQIDRVDRIVKSLLTILSSRVSSEEVDDKSVVCLKKDEEVTVTDDDGEHTETVTVDDEKTLFYTEVTYSVPSVASYNEATDSNLSEEDFYYNVLCKLHDVNFDSALSFAKTKFSALDSAIVTDIIETNKRWHTLLNAVSVSKVSLNRCLKASPETRAELLNLHYIFDEKVSKVSVPSNSMMQGSIFDFEEFTEVNILTDGGSDDE